MNRVLVLFCVVYLSLTWTIAENADWWKHTTIYQIFTSSFKDSNGDGIGDLNGITSKLDHFKDLGIDCIYLTPFFKSGQCCAGYDITNYTEIHPIYGTMEDFDRLMRETKQRNIKLLIDLVINHSGTEHEWFLKSQERNGKYTDYYVWVDAKGYNQDHPIPPNNWQNIFGGSAWTWNDKRRQFYLHQFIAQQPDLNLRSEALKDELKQIIAFWIDKGVSGMRLDAVQHLVEDAQFRDEPLSNPYKQNIEGYGDLNHIYTVTIPETFQVLHELRTFTDDYTKKNNKSDGIYIAECIAANNQQIREYHGRPDYTIVHFPFNFRLVYSYQWYEAKQFDDRIKEYMSLVPQEAPFNWMLENQDFARVTNRYCEEYSTVLLTAIMTLPGVAIIYYGQEIAISGFSSPGTNYDKAERLPMQWDGSSNAGFTTNIRPWLPVHSNYWRVNVANQKNQTSSPYQVFKKLQHLRYTKTLRYGDLKTYVVSTWIYAFVRSFPTEESFITVINFGSNEETVDLHRSINDIPQQLQVVVGSPNGGYRTDDLIKIRTGFTMKPLSSLVLTTKLTGVALTTSDSTTSEDVDWWKHATIYQIFIPSFKDSNGDGIGDLNGITSKLDHFKDLGIDGIHLTPFFKSGPNYAGYDIFNYMEIQPTYGTLEDFDRLVQELKRRKMKLLIDLVINHSGIQHEWFSKSQERNGKYTDYYVWADPNGYNGWQANPPNNWQSVFGGSAWTWNDKRRQFYLHQFFSDQPDLNFRSTALKDEIKQIIAFWIDKGVSGMSLVSAQHFMEDASLQDEGWDRIRTSNILEIFHLIHELRMFTDEYTKQNKESNCIFLAQSTTANHDQMREYHGRSDYPVAHFPYNLKLVGTYQWFEAKQFDDRIKEWLDLVPQGAPSNWMLENHDVARVTNRYCEEYSSLLLTAIMTLPGTAFVYYGQEIALSGFSPPGVHGDKYERLPMQWDNSSNAGFTTNRRSWLPVHPNHWRVNVADHKNQSFSPYQMFKKLQQIRKTKTLKYGDLKTYVVSTWIYAFVRSFPTYESYVTVLNFGTNEQKVNLRCCISDLPQQLRVSVASPNAAYKTKDMVNIALNFTMNPLSSLVFTTELTEEGVPFKPKHE